MKTFEELGVSEEIRRAIAELGFESPMPVQEEVIPYLLGNKNDVVALAQTGTGKTAAYGIPVLQKIDPSDRSTQALILSPTRELCLQISDDLNDFGKYIGGLNVVPVYGGTSIQNQIHSLRHGAQVIVATPGRLIDLMNRGVAQLDKVENVVLDEADEMLNMGFADSINAIFEGVPQDRNTLLFSATMSREIERIAKKYGLKVIYDAAHVFGVRYKGKGIANFGDASMFSFHATKVYHTIEGGAVCYHDPELGHELYKLRDFGIKDAETIDGVGSNAKMNEFVAAMGLCTLRHVDEEIAKRKAVVECYRKYLSGIDGIQLPPIQENVQPNYAYFPIVVHEKEFGATRNEIFAKLAENNIHARKYFYPLTNAFDAYHGRFDPNLTPVALHISKRVLTIPLYADLALEDVKRICDIIVSMKK